MRLVKEWTALLSIIKKSDLYDNIKQDFFQAVVVSIQLYGCTKKTLTKGIQKKYREKARKELYKNVTSYIEQILEATLHETTVVRALIPISKTIKIRRHSWHYWKSKDELQSDVLRWTPSHGRASVGRPTKTYLQQPSADRGCSLENVPRVMDKRDKWGERESQGNPCQQRDLIIVMILINKNIQLFITQIDRWMDRLKTKLQHTEGRWQIWPEKSIYMGSVDANLCFRTSAHFLISISDTIIYRFYPK